MWLLHPEATAIPLWRCHQSGHPGLDNRVAELPSIGGPGICGPSVPSLAFRGSLGTEPSSQFARRLLTLARETCDVMALNFPGLGLRRCVALIVAIARSMSTSPMSLDSSNALCTLKGWDREGL